MEGALSLKVVSIGIFPFNSSEEKPLTLFFLSKIGSCVFEDYTDIIWVYSSIVVCRWEVEGDLW